MPTRPLKLLLVAGMLSLTPAYGETPRVLEDFEAFQENDVPSKGWRTRGGAALGIYRIASQKDNKYLEAKTELKSVQLFREGGWSLKEQAHLQWRWRANTLPEGADERKKGANDSAAAIYVLFPRKWFIPEVIKYVWSTSAPVGAVIRKSEHVVMIVVRSGPADVGNWKIETRNVREDYAVHFGKSVPDPLAIGVLTDSDGVKKKAAADYDDFKAVSTVP